MGAFGPPFHFSAPKPGADPWHKGAAGNRAGRTTGGSCDSWPGGRARRPAGWSFAPARCGHLCGPLRPGCGETPRRWPAPPACSLTQVKEGASGIRHKDRKLQRKPWPGPAPHPVRAFPGGAGAALFPSPGPVPLWSRVLPFSACRQSAQPRGLAASQIFPKDKTLMQVNAPAPRRTHDRAQKIPGRIPGEPRGQSRNQPAVQPLQGP